MRARRFPQEPRAPPPLLGERAGVRASVQSILAVPLRRRRLSSMPNTHLARALRGPRPSVSTRRPTPTASRRKIRLPVQSLLSPGLDDGRGFHAPVETTPGDPNSLRQTAPDRLSGLKGYSDTPPGLDEDGRGGYCAMVKPSWKVSTRCARLLRTCFNGLNRLPVSTPFLECGRGLSGQKRCALLAFYPYPTIVAVICQ